MIDGDEMECPICQTPHHKECWAANGGSCSVFGCESRSEDKLAGCPWCDEVYPADRGACMICNSPLLNPAEYFEFLSRYEWKQLPLADDDNPLLTAGYLRNQGLVVRLKKRAPISMFGLPQQVKLSVAGQDEEYAKSLLAELKANYTRCIICGHVISKDDQDCSFCVESRGAEA